MTATTRPSLDFTTPAHRTFGHLLVNVLVVSVINFTVWFAITFWVFLQTTSVLATGMVAGIFLVVTSLTGIWLGSLVDHYRKKVVMQVSAICSLVAYALAFALYQLAPTRPSPAPTASSCGSSS